VSEAVLDASALLALLNGEPGAETVAGILQSAAISAVNLSEVVAKLAEAGMPEVAIRQALDGLALEVSPFDAGQAYQAGTMRPLTMAAGLSLGDRACLALAQARKVPALTADTAWRGLDLGIEVQVIR
jgi:PIN domain nuclease of toxin-antitoxin system